MPKVLDYRSPQPLRSTSTSTSTSGNAGFVAPLITIGTVAVANWAMIYGAGVQGFFLLLAAPLANIIILGVCLWMTSLIADRIASAGLQYAVSIAAPAISVLVDWHLAWRQMPNC